MYSIKKWRRFVETVVREEAGFQSLQPTVASGEMKKICH